MTAFALDPRLAADTLPVARLPLSALRLMNDRRWPWLVLVPERAGASEWHDLAASDRAALAEEMAAAGRALKEAGGADKINTGALGNLVPQLHVHVVARRREDPAWPDPVWGFSTPEPYGSGEAEALIHEIREAVDRQ